jgi:5-methylcytosine-specific restriction endonuclease McrA
VTDPFYSSTAWKKVRAKARARDGGCVVCGATVGLDVDHIVPWQQRPDLALDLTNLRTLCRLHHNRKTKRSNANVCQTCKRQHKSCRFHSPTTCTCPHSRLW